MLNAITLRNPWASCIVDPGFGFTTPKRCENRGQKVNHRGTIAIHAGLAWDKAGLADWRVQKHLFGATNLDPDATGLLAQGYPTGAVLAVADLIDCHPAEVQSIDDQPSEACCWPWGDLLYGPQRKPAWHYVLDNVRALDEPIPCKGRLTIGWELPADVEAQVLSQINNQPLTKGAHRG